MSGMRYGDRSSFGSEVRRISQSTLVSLCALYHAIKSHLGSKFLWCFSNSILGVSRSSDLLRITSSTRSPTTSAGRSSSPWKMRSEYHHLKVASVLHDFLKDTHSHLAANIAIHWRSIHLYLRWIVWWRRRTPPSSRRTSSWWTPSWPGRPRGPRGAR